MISTTNTGLCGYYGKIPARADFVGSRLRRETIELWDRWLQEALAVSQSCIGSGWRERFFTAPIWRFILPRGACGRSNLMGILMPSVDSVGRCFPLMLAHELEGEIDPLGLMAGSSRWFAAAEELALAALGERFELDHFNCILPSWQALAWPGSRAAQNHQGKRARSLRMSGGIGAWVALPVALAASAMAGAALLAAGWNGDTGAWPGIWWTAGAQSTASTQGVDPMPGLVPGLAISRGLVPPSGFAALLDGCWRQHGWTVDSPTPEWPEHGGPLAASQGRDQDGDWERQA